MKNTFSSGNNREIHGYGQQTNASCVVFSWMTLIFFGEFTFMFDICCRLCFV
jgi:hypothetical protein